MPVPQPPVVPASPAVPAATWSPVGRNPYGEAVEENAQGLRRVSTEAGWTEEQKLPKWRACRATSPEEGRQAMLSLADPWVSAGFDHNLRRAYLVYRLSPGQSVQKIPAHWGTDQDPGWGPFNKGVLTARGDRVLRAWLRRRPQAPNVPKWSLALPAQSPTAVRALQWGLAHRLEAWAAQHPGSRFVEMGLVNPADAATARLNAHQRQAYASVPAAPWAPPSDVLKGWLPVPGKASGAFGKKATASWGESQVPVVWATQAALRTHGPDGLEDWWTALAHQPAGVVVLDSPLPGATSVLLPRLKAAGRRPGRVRVTGLGEVWSWGLGMDAQDVALAPEAWAVPQEPPVVEEVSLASDERVPYRALSQSSDPEGMAGRTLESNMHAALQDFQRARGNESVDEWVAHGLGVDPVTLVDRLSAEQIDAIALARQSLEQGTGFLLSDETGFGKGRTLAALALTGLRQGRPVVFITENPYLFSDFYRDLLAVDEAQHLIPALLHQNATVKDPAGRKVAQSLKGNRFKDFLRQHEWGERADKLVFTTYAQLSHSKGKGKDDFKMGWLKDRLGPTGWLLLDEAHNAAGQSSVGEQVDKLAGVCSGVVFASATFAKTESNLDRYKAVLALPSAAQRLLRLALAGDDGRLREALTQQMARAGRLMRREHPPVPPPQPFWVDMTPEREAAVHAFGAAWRGLFDATAAYGQLSGVRESIWLHLGAALSRSVREFGLQIKADALVEVIQTKIAENLKVVVVVDTTMEAALREALTPDQDEDMLDEEEQTWEDDGAVEGVKAAPPQMVREGSGAPPLWKDRLRAILEAVCPRSSWEGRVDRPAQVAGKVFQEAEAALESLPDWDLAPLDRVRRSLAGHGIDSSELSGRQTRLLVQEDGWKVINRDDPDRNEVVRSFNAGELDVLFVTRAGCAGISLHAGQKFADQRIRCLIEWDIAANPVNRVQFWGRVRRKDQVVEPEFMGLVMDTPEDRRIVEREDRKRRRLASHLGTSVAESVGWLSELGEAIVEEWAEERSVAAFRIGVTRPMPDNPIGRVDRALVRSLVLPDAERTGLLSRLERGIQLGAQAFALERDDQAHRSSRVIRRAWWWGDPAASVADPAQALSALRLDLVERVWRPDPGASAQTIAEHVRREHPLQPTGQAVLDQWRRAWASELAPGAKLTPYRERTGKWLMANLPALNVGQAIVFTHPSTGRITRAVLLGWSLPDPTPLPGGASPWALSQVSLNVWAVGDSNPLELPLLRLFKDPGFQLLKCAASPAWYQAPPVPLRALAIEGHPVQAAAWGRRWGVGRSTLVRDTDEGPQVVWLLPPHVTWEKALTLPRDLVDVDHAIAFWRAYPNEALSATLPHGQRLTATPVSGGLMVAFGQETIAAAKDTWLNPHLLRKLRLTAYGAAPGWMQTKVEWKQVPRLLHSLAAAGIGWRMPSQYLEWYQRTSPERTKAKTG